MFPLLPLPVLSLQRTIVPVTGELGSPILASICTHGLLQAMSRLGIAVRSEPNVVLAAPELGSARHPASTAPAIVGATRPRRGMGANAPKTDNHFTRSIPWASPGSTRRRHRASPQRRRVNVTGQP